MKVRIVGFKKTIGMPQFSNDQPLVVEADLEEGETMGEAWSKMNQAAIDWHKAEYPHLYQESKVDSGMDLLEHMQRSSPPIPQVIDLQEVRLRESIEDMILECNTLEELASLKQSAGANGLVSQYMNRLQELSSK